MALMKKPKQKLISVAGAKAKAPAAAKRAKAVKPGKKKVTNAPEPATKKGSPLDRFKKKDGGKKTAATKSSRSPK